MVFKKVQDQVTVELSRKDTKMMQGLAILAMICLHLFDTYDYQGKFEPLLFFKGYPLIFYFAQISDFCVMAFAFVGGYGHMAQYEKAGDFRHRLKRLLRVYITFWTVLIIFTIVSVITGHAETMPGSVTTFIGNLTSAKLTYNGAWWYLLTYAFIVFTSPLLLKVGKKSSDSRVLILIAFGLTILYGMSFYVNFHIIPENWLLRQLFLYGMTMPEYMIGVLAYEHHLFDRVKSLWQRILPRRFMRVFTSVVVFFSILFGHTLIVPSCAIAPATGIIILFLFWMAEKPKWIEACFLTLGKHSTVMWLTHMFFYTTLFTGLVYQARYPILIFLLMIGITMGVSICVQFIISIVTRAICRILNRISEE